MGLGIISGAMTGAGAAGTALANRAGDYLERSTLQQEMAEIANMRDARLSELRKGEMAYGEELRRKPYAEAAAAVDKARTEGVVDNSGAAFEERPRTPAEMRELEKGEYKKRGLIDAAMHMDTQDITRDEHQKTRDLTERLAKLTDERIRSEAELNREQQLELHQERMAELKSQAKNLGLSVQQTDQGIAIVNATTKEVTMLKDAEGKPLKGAKQEDSLAIIKSIGELAKSMETTNPEMAKKLGDIAIKVLSTKLGTDVGPQPTDDDIAGLRQRAGNPAAVAYFETKYGKGSASRYVSAAAPAGGGRPAPAGAAIVNGAQPGPAREADPIQAAQLRREAEMRGEYDRSQADKRRQEDEYQQEFRDNLTRTNLRSGM